VEGALDLEAGAVVVDGTLGLGGHSAMIAAKIGVQGHLIGIDQDARAIALARLRLKDFKGRLDIVKSNFSKLDEVLKGLGVEAVDGILLDLGVSSLQLDDPQRGFSFRSDGPLDMRMDGDAGTTAEELVNELPEKELADLIFHYGEERFSRRIAQRIVTARAGQRIRTTGELADIVLRSLPRGYQRDKLHPATRTFQAIRIAVNRELEVLEEALVQAFKHLKIGGRIAVIAFHSLEDRIVKEKFRALAREGSAVLLTKKPLRPTESEAADNPRSRSARLRVLERIVQDG
jgi:16S rRNA (cytosine1402-N4)-methyltransferase